MNRKVLVITPFFAPETHAAVFRAHKLVKYLKRKGWKPTVLTVDTNYVYNEDLKLLDELNGVTIYRSKYIEPTIRGLKMALGGADRTYKTIKKTVNNTSHSSDSKQKNPVNDDKKSLSSKFYNYLLENHLQTPDRFWSWKKSAVKMAKKIIKEENISIIYTTCLPFTCNEIGISLKKSTSVKWVADFRDPITYSSRLYSEDYKIFIKQKKIQDLTFKYADQIVGLASSYGLIFHDQYGGKYDYKFNFIPTGLDDDYIPQKQKEKENTFLFIGEYLKEYKNYFFKLYKEATKDLPINKIPKIVIIGRKDVNESVALPYLEELGMVKQVVFHDHMPQSELYKFVEKSRFTLLINGNSYWWTNFAKLVDYIALQKRVIAIVPNISEAKSELEKSNLGEFLNYDDESIDTLKELILEDNKKIKKNNTYHKRYLASSQVDSFISIFEKL